MKHLAARFERLVEGFLTGDLERHMRILSWATIGLVVVCILSVVLVSRFEIPLAQGKKLPLNELLFPNRP